MVPCAAAVIMRLTPRDRILIEVLHELRYLTVAQIRQACFPSAALGTTSHRLTLLRRRGLLDCFTHRTFDDRRAFWSLARLGRAIAGTLTEGSPDRPRTCALAALRMDHLIATNQVFCDLCSEHQAGRLGPFRWFGSHHAPVDLGETGVIPDAVILAASPEGHRWMYCLELDQGTMAPPALCAKFTRYRLLHRIASLRRHEPLWEVRAASWVLFACRDARRASHAAHLAAECGLERLWAGTATELAAGLAASVGPGTLVLPADSLPGLVGGIAPPAASAPTPTVQREGLP